MKIYLDIDGTLIHEDATDNNGKPAASLGEFLIALRQHETYWLTTHCTLGDPQNAASILKAVLPDYLHPDVDRIKGTTWAEMKTEALDWDSDFIWFSNDVEDAEWEVLAKYRPGQSVVQIDLKTNPNQLRDIIRDII